MEFWSDESEGPADAVAQERTAVFNLAYLGFDGLAVCDLALAERVAIASRAISGWAPYLDDRRIPPWSEVQEKDRYTAAFRRFESAPIEWLNLPPLDAEQALRLPSEISALGKMRLKT